MIGIFLAECRGIEEKVSKKTGVPYWILHMEEPTGKTYNVVSKVSPASFCKKGVNLQLTIDFNIGSKFTSVDLIACKEVH